MRLNCKRIMVIDRNVTVPLQQKELIQERFVWVKMRNL